MPAIQAGNVLFTVPLFVIEPFLFPGDVILQHSLCAGISGSCDENEEQDKDRKLRN